MCNASRPSRDCPRPEPATVPCRVCGGTGRVMGTNWRTYHHAQIETKCLPCHGTGRVPALEHRYANETFDAIVRKQKETRDE